MRPEERRAIGNQVSGCGGRGARRSPTGRAGRRDDWLHGDGERSLGLAGVGGLEIGDEAGEKAGSGGFAGNGVVVHEVTAAAAEDLVNGGGHEIGGLG